jgi:hypothetical protein
MVELTTELKDLSLQQQGPRPTIEDTPEGALNTNMFNKRKQQTDNEGLLPFGDNTMQEMANAEASNMYPNNISCLPFFSVEEMIAKASSVFPDANHDGLALGSEPPTLSLSPYASIPELEDRNTTTRSRTPSSRSRGPISSRAHVHQMQA